MFLKYDFQPQDMLFDMNSIIITKQNANSTTSDVPASSSEKLSTMCTWIKKENNNNNHPQKHTHTPNEKKNSLKIVSAFPFCSFVLI